MIISINISGNHRQNYKKTLIFLAEKCTSMGSLISVLQQEGYQCLDEYEKVKAVGSKVMAPNFKFELC